MLSTTQTLLTDSAKRLSLTNAELQALLTPNIVHEFTITLSSGKQFKAYRSQHSNTRGPYKGGIRFHPDVNKDEVVALSILMSLKTSLVNIPLGGGKGGIAVDPRQLSEEELEELSRKYVQYLAPYIGPYKDIPAPDVQTNPKIIDWMVDEYSHLTGDTTKASFTGKSLSNGGSEGREEATGRGGFIVAKALVQNKDASYAVQGFGNVGTYFALAAEVKQPNWRFVAAADSKTAISAKTLKARSLVDYKQKTGSLLGFTDSVAISAEELLHGSYDMLVLAALGGVITEKNAQNINATYVLELANGPVTDVATTMLEAKGTVVVPDILANAGGVVVSYYEWLQNIQGVRWTATEVLEKLDATMLAAVEEVTAYQIKTHTTLKEAAIDVAVRRLIDKK